MYYECWVNQFGVAIAKSGVKSKSTMINVGKENHGDGNPSSFFDINEIGNNITGVDDDNLIKIEKLVSGYLRINYFENIGVDTKNFGEIIANYVGYAMFYKKINIGIKNVAKMLMYSIFDDGIRNEVKKDSDDHEEKDDEKKEEENINMNMNWNSIMNLNKRKKNGMNVIVFEHELTRATKFHAHPEKQIIITLETCLNKSNIISNSNSNININGSKNINSIDSYKFEFGLLGVQETSKVFGQEEKKNNMLASVDSIYEFLYNNRIYKRHWAKGIESIGQQFGFYKSAHCCYFHFECNNTKTNINSSNSNAYGDVVSSACFINMENTSEDIKWGMETKLDPMESDHENIKKIEVKDVNMACIEEHDKIEIRLRYDDEQTKTFVTFFKNGQAYENAIEIELISDHSYYLILGVDCYVESKYMFQIHPMSN